VKNQNANYEIFYPATSWLKETSNLSSLT